MSRGRHAAAAAARSLLDAAHGPVGLRGGAARLSARAPRRGLRERRRTTCSARRVARVAGTDGGRRVAVVGHIDEIGLIVTHIDDEGFLWFTGVGGWDPQILVGQRVDARDPRRAGPRRRRQEADPPAQGRGAQEGPRARATCTSTSARRTATRRARLVRVGDVAVIAGEPVELPNGRFVSRSMDNRLGCYVALEAARLVAEAGGAPGDVVAVAVAQEEITFAGARTTAFALAARRRDRRRRHARDRRAGDRGASELGSHQLGSGPVHRARLDAAPARLRAAARGRRGGGASRSRVEASARAHRHRRRRRPLQPRRRPDGGSSRLPLRYMHSPVEMVQLADVDAAARLIAAFCRRLEAGHRLRALSAAARAALFDIDGTLLQGATVEHAAAIRGRDRARPRRRARTSSGSRPPAAPTSRSRATILRCSRASAPAASTPRLAESRRGRCAQYARRVPGDLSRRVAPGVPELLDGAGRARRRRRLSLVTGNFEPIARLKLRAAGIGGYFAAGQGGFGSDARGARARCRRSPAPAPATGEPFRASARSSSATRRATSPARAPTACAASRSRPGPTAPSSWPTPTPSRRRHGLLAALDALSVGREHPEAVEADRLLGRDGARAARARRRADLADDRRDLLRRQRLDRPGRAPRPLDDGAGRTRPRGSSWRDARRRRSTAGSRERDPYAVAVAHDS